MTRHEEMMSIAKTRLGDQFKYATDDILNLIESKKGIEEWYAEEIEKRPNNRDFLIRRESEIHEEDIEELNKIIDHFLSTNLNPINAKVGMGARFCMFSDINACTVIAVSKSGKKITVQRDKATRIDNNGAFSECQEYTYERDPNGYIEVARWSDKYNRYFVGGASFNNCRVYGGRSEYFDYSF